MTDERSTASTAASLSRRQFLGLTLGAAALPTATAALGTAPRVARAAGPVELRWVADRQPAPALAFDRAQVWAQRTGKAQIVRAPISYQVYVEKMSAELLLDKPNADILWHNDDWGQLWGQYLEPLEDITEIRAKTDTKMYAPFWVWDGKVTGLPWVQTLQSFFIRKDLIPEKEVVDWHWTDVVDRLSKLQKAGKVKWGFVGGMKYPHDYFTWLWSLWANNTDLYAPAYERDNAVLQKTGWKSLARTKNWVEVANFWWDAVHTNNICPPGLPGYSRTDADAIFMAGGAAMVNQDTTLFGTYRDPQKSKIHDRIGFAGFPMGPSATKRDGHQAPWGFAIPRKADPEKKAVAKEVLRFLLTDEESQALIWTKTGGFPSNNDVVKKLAASDPLFNHVADVTIRAPLLVLPAYYFPQWPKANATLSDMLGKGIIGAKSDFPKVLDELAAEFEKIPQA